MLHTRRRLTDTPQIHHGRFALAPLDLLGNPDAEAREPLFPDRGTRATCPTLLPVPLVGGRHALPPPP